MLRTRDQNAVVRDAIDVLFCTVGRLPPSEATNALRARVEECARWVDVTNAASSRDRDGLMKRVLALHMDVAKVERGAHLARTPTLGADARLDASAWP